MPKRIVLVEDDPALRKNYSAALIRQGYELESFADKASAEESFNQQLPDIAILDISLGDEPEAGFELCRILRAKSEQVPIIFFTARDSELDTISGLRLGADDYLTKNITLEQLTARVAALLRRVDALTKTTHQSKVIEQGDLVIDTDCMNINWQSQSVDLTLTEFWIVHSLAKIAGHVKSREQLMQDAKIFVDDGTVTSHIKRIRKKFKKIDEQFDSVETIYGMGYRWNI